MGSVFSTDECPCSENYEYDTEKKSDSMFRVQILSNDKIVTIRSFFELLKSSRKFRSFFVSLLRDVPLSSFLIEMIPISRETENNEFEFVVIDLPEDLIVEADPQALNNFASNPSFLFPRRDDSVDLDKYRCLSSFIKSCPTAYAEQLFHNFADLIVEKISGDYETIWVTSGDLSIPWAHLRCSHDYQDFQYEDYCPQDKN